jgi:rod shape determining protein RodA
MQQVWFAVGFVFMLVAAFVDYHYIASFYIPIYALNILLLVLVFVLDTDPNPLAPSRWINFERIGIPVGIQPSEFCKIFMIIFLAKFIDKKNESINNVSVLLLIILSAALPVLLVYLQPSLTVSICIAAMSAIIIFAGNVSYKYVLVVSALAVLFVLFILYDMQRESPFIADKILQGYQEGRFTVGEQTLLSQESIGSGQLYGKGLYKGRGIIDLPLSENDFIFAVVGEEFGFMGCVTVLGVMLLIILKCLLIAQHAADLMGKLIASGVAGLLAVQIFINTGVATGLLPNTGITFPFLSAGGSALWVNMMNIGLVLNVGMSKQKSIFEG